MTPSKNDAAVAALRLAIKASGLSARRYAVEILTRDERTVRRWLAGDVNIPRAVVESLMLPPLVTVTCAGCGWSMQTRTTSVQRIEGKLTCPQCKLSTDFDDHV